MATSPAHRFGQLIGDLLEEIMLPQLQKFCKARGLYLDKRGDRPARNGKKLIWRDRYENSHDLDFVIEKDGTDDKIGRPVAFIEAAWRRYTKHSKNKVQEIQSAVLPIAEKYSWDKPFLGAILAGLFTDPSLRQIESSGFNVALFSYESIINAFDNIGIDVRFDESTSDKIFARVIAKIEKLKKNEREQLKSLLVSSNSNLLNCFFSQLEITLDRQIDELILIPLYGNSYSFSAINELKNFIDNYIFTNKNLEFNSYKIIVSYSNSDKIEANFHNKESLLKFIDYISLK
jgi:hypothetical protein